MLLAGLGALGGPAPAAGAGEAWRLLRGLRAVAIDVVLSPDHPQLLPDDLARRLEAALATQPGLRVDAEAADTLRLLVAVRAVSASDLRGYYLPFSGVYGIGPVRLQLERPASLAGQPGPAGVVVWEAERLALGPWHGSGARVRALVDELVDAFLDDQRRAGGR
jgi:hypothetical protein